MFCFFFSFLFDFHVDVPPPKQEKPIPEFKEPVVEVEKLENQYGNTQVKSFTFRELASATRNFRQEFLVGEGGLGRVYKGKLPGDQVKIKRLQVFNLLFFLHN